MALPRDTRKFGRLCGFFLFVIFLSFGVERNKKAMEERERERGRKE